MGTNYYLHRRADGRAAAERTGPGSCCPECPGLHIGKASAPDTFTWRVYGPDDGPESPAQWVNLLHGTRGWVVDEYGDGQPPRKFLRFAVGRHARVSDREFS